MKPTTGEVDVAHAVPQTTHRDLPAQARRLLSAAGVKEYGPSRFAAPARQGTPIVFLPRSTPSEVLDANDIGDEEVALLFETSISLLKSWNLPPCGARVFASAHEDSSSGILVCFMVKGEAGAVADAEWKLFGELASLESKVLFDGFISVALVAFQEGDCGN